MRPTMSIRRFAFCAGLLIAAAVLEPRTAAQQTQRFIFAALPGVGGGNNMKYGGWTTPCRATSRSSRA